MTASLDIFSLPCELKPGQRLRWGGLSGSSLGLAIANYARACPGLVLAVTENRQQAERLFSELEFFSAGAEPALLIDDFPDWETLPYDNFSPHQDIVSRRLETLHRLPQRRHGVLIVSVTTLMHRLAPRSYVMGNTLLLELGQTFPMEEMRRTLEAAGYTCVDSVYEHGEFAVRGSIMDLFPMGAREPVRIELFDDEIESLRNFDPETQLSRAPVSEVRLLPGREYPLTQAAIATFRQNFREAFDIDVRRCPLYEDISRGFASPGIEYYLPLFFEQQETLFDYLPEQVTVFTTGEPHEGAQQFWREIGNRYEDRAVDKQRPILPPERLFLPVEELFGVLGRYAVVNLRTMKGGAATAVASAGLASGVPDGERSPASRLPQEAGDRQEASRQEASRQEASRQEDSRQEDSRQEDSRQEGNSREEGSPGEGAGDALSGRGLHGVFRTRTFPELGIDHKLENPLQRLEAFLRANEGTPILLCSDSPGRRETLLELLRSIQVRPEVLPDWQSFLRERPALAITVAPIDSGLWLDAPELIVIAENQLFAHHVSQRRRRGKFTDNTDFIVKSLTELREGAPVVHLDHGIGRYRGLQTFDVEGQRTEFLVIEYADAAKLYVPVSSLHLISRYSGADADAAPLHKLGSDQWLKARRKAAEKIVDVAAELLEVYARREAQKGRAFSPPGKDYQLFADSFPFEETEDQTSAIRAVIDDMSSPRPMDRLVCGDVGFGKTEVAMRAAFLAVQDATQVAVLVPTTLLAQQHYENFKDRFADWPVQVELMSRFVSDTAQDKTLQRLAEGKVDIVIGTHKLLNKDIKYRNLGLLIIDEEHRFGVRQKEQLKAMRANVDILTLTATPIPRTLNLSMSGMRDLSLITTPPARRLSVKTFVRQSEPRLIKEAILRELLRGGQVFYLHNEVKSIERAAEEIRALVPEARVCVGHGQMRERELEKVMSEFYHKHYNVLVCSTIIETGIDIPSANTIIIERADKFGLAQLHQLRGRVGRSHHQAYAYLLTPHPKAMTEDAKKRIEAIQAADTLGAGFTLASHDLEIRGAGELLGDEQSGHIQTIGFTLFNEMLDQTVKLMKEGKTLDIERPLQASTEVNLRIPALIPEDYLPDVHTRLLIYKRIANAGSAAELSELKAEMIDRFGPLPEATALLFELTRLKLEAEGLGIAKVEANARTGKIEFKPDTSVDPYAIVSLVQEQPGLFTLQGGMELKFRHEQELPQERIGFVGDVLKRLRPEKRQVA